MAPPMPVFVVLLMVALPLILVSMGLNFVIEIFDGLISGITGIFRRLG